MLVKAGSTLLIPKSDQSADHDISQLVVNNASLVIARDNTRKINVAAGKRDSLTSIAKRYKVSTAQLKEWNNLKSDSIKSGQKLQIEVAAAPVKRSPVQTAAVSSKRVGKKQVAQPKMNKKITVAQAKTHKPG